MIARASLRRFLNPRCFGACVLDCGGCDAALECGCRPSPKPFSPSRMSFESGVALRLPPHSKTLRRFWPALLDFFEYEEEFRDSLRRLLLF